MVYKTIWFIHPGGVYLPIEFFLSWVGRRIGFIKKFDFKIYWLPLVLLYLFINRLKLSFIMNSDNHFISYSVRSFNETDVVLSKILKADCSIQTDDVINDYQRKIDELEKENRTLKKNIKLISSHMKNIPFVECHKG